MYLNEYAVLAMRTSNKRLSLQEHVQNGVLGLAGEAGECCDLVKKCYYQDGRLIRQALLDELGDVLWYVVETATALGFSLEAVAEHNVEKLKSRYPEGFSAERSLHRDDGEDPYTGRN